MGSGSQGYSDEKEGPRKSEDSTPNIIRHGYGV
jgi:hypothetical protein